MKDPNSAHVYRQLALAATDVTQRSVTVMNALAQFQEFAAKVEAERAANEANTANEANEAKEVKEVDEVKAEETASA
jgi:hypothetical protein